MTSSFRLPKSFKQAQLDTSAVESEALAANKTQLWHFAFPLEFNVAAFSELELHIPAEPISSTSQVAQHVASFELEGVSYRLLEGSVFEVSDLVNLFPSTSEVGVMHPGRPFTRCFRVCREVTFPAPPKPVPVNPRGRAPEQLKEVKKNFHPIGYINEKLTAELQRGDRQGRVLRSTSARPGSPRLLPLHGFDLAEWAPAVKEEKKSSKKGEKKEKKEKKRSAEAEAAEEGPKKKKQKKDKQ